MLLTKLQSKGLIAPPSFLVDNCMYLTRMGSEAYGVSTGTSDVDIYGWCIPPKDVIFPHLAGQIDGFGRQKQKFEQWQQHHIKDSETSKEYDFAIYNIVKYFQLCMENNPNMVDSLFVPQFCIIHSTQVSTLVRDNKKLFLHKGSWKKFKSYAYAQLHKMSSKDPIGKRKEIREQYGFDVKFAYHIVRLLDEAEQILVYGDIDLQRNREHLKAIRRGEVSEADIRYWAAEKEKSLEKLYIDSKLQYSPDEDKIKSLLLNCLEIHYGNLKNCVVEVDKATRLVREIKELIEKANI